MHLKNLMLETCRTITPLLQRVARHNPPLADQGRRAMQSMVLQYAEGLHAHGRNRTAKLLGSRSEAYETASCLELAEACGLLTRQDIHEPLDLLDRIPATLWLKVHRPL